MEGAEEELTANDGTEEAHLKRKESDLVLMPDSYNVSESPATFVSSGNNWSDNSLQAFTDLFEGKNVQSCVSSLVGSDPPCASPCSMNDGGITVEELTLKNYKNSNLPVVGSSKSREGMQIRPGQWQHLYQLAGGSGNGNSHGEIVSQDKKPGMPSGREEVASMRLPEIWVQKPLPCKQPIQNHAEISEHLCYSDNRTISSNILSPRGIRTKILPSSGFSQFFVKNSLKGKGMVCRKPEGHDDLGVAAVGQNHEKTAFASSAVSDALPNSSAKVDETSLHNVAVFAPNSIHDGINLREWLRLRNRKINKFESLCIFRRIVELVDLTHSKGVALPDIRPSCFNLLPANQVIYVGLLTQRKLLGSVTDQDIPYTENNLNGKRSLRQGLHAYDSLRSKHQRINEHTKLIRQQPQFSARSGFKLETAKGIHNTSRQDIGHESGGLHTLNTEHSTRNKSSSANISHTNQQHTISLNVHLEEKWYTSPEELHEKGCTFPSNMYNLGVLLFELLSVFESSEVHATAMLDLRHRILPPNFLSENPKEAGFCLWLLHPEPSSRPTTREILQSEIMCESQEVSHEDNLSLSADEDDAEAELLMHFLFSLKEQKQKHASKLVDKIGCLEADLKEVEKRHILRTAGVLPRADKSSSYKEPLKSDEVSLPPVSNLNEARLLKNINHLENAYFSMRSQIQLPEIDASARSDRDFLKNRGKCSPVQSESGEWSLNQRPADGLGAFFDGVCKYACYNKLEVRGTLRNGDLLNSANVICSLSFDRDEDYFAAAGVSKKIKIFEFNALLSDSVDIHYPVVEMPSKSRLSCVCWNNYIKNYLASTNYDGVVQLWDASTGQGFSQYIGHQKRAWSVDFSQVDPMKLASGSDDCSVKLWSINEKNCINTIKSVANICCVQFSSRSTHLLAFGSADYKTYCYDLRNTKIPWCTLAGHGKAVSFVKFLDAETLISASTDSTLKLWDLNKTSCSGLSNRACGLTFSGHANEKNFVGLSVSDGYIACGSETNEVYSYYRSLPMPITSHKFGSIDPISGHETSDDNGQFVSSVCWRGKSNMIVAANSSGSIKLLEMV